MQKFPLLSMMAAIRLCSPGAVADENAERDDLAREFASVVLPFVNDYCIGCHGHEKPKAKFDLTPFQSLDAVVNDFGHWDLVLDRLEAREMPPEEAGKHPDDPLRQQVANWIGRLRRHEADRNAGDPGAVLTRRLSNAEFDASILDLTGVDIRPTREFPVDPANAAGFDNTGESLALSPALLAKYLEAARLVADHLLFLPDGLAFAPHPVVTYSDRDKYCVHRIIDFYDGQPTDLADYFRAALWHRNRPESSLEEAARLEAVSARYLRTVWELLTDSTDDAGPVAELRRRWKALPDETGCEALRDFVEAERRRYLLAPSEDFRVKGLHSSHQAIILWQDRELAALRRAGKLPEPDGSQAAEELRRAIARFCDVFPDAFYVSERGRMFLPPEKREKGRHLSAGFHMMLGYFRDDAPLYDLILDDEARRKLDRMWDELEFLPRTPKRQFADFVYLERGEAPAFLQSEEFAFAREDDDVTSEEKMGRLAELYMVKVREAGIAERIFPIIEDYFREMSGRARRLERQEKVAESRHLEDVLAFARRAWQHPLSEDEESGLHEFYAAQRQVGALSHEDAVRDVVASVLLSPKFFFRSNEPEAGTQATPLSNHELASRLSYFLWSSLPDTELSALADSGDLHRPEVLLRQTRRMLEDPKVRRLAVEFAGNWLDFRRFESHNGVDRERFPAFTDDLRQAMFEEPVRFFTDLAQSDGSVLDFLEAGHTFVNPVLARHYGLPADSAQGWWRVENAGTSGRGGLLPMAVFLTANSPGLRTSPVKRGYWVVRRLLGERIPPPPPQVPQLPEDEASLGDLSLRDMLAGHREEKTCATCHQRFDSVGLVFEGYGPTGERRELDLGGRPVDASAEFPDGTHGEGMEGLRDYLLRNRRDDFVDHFCRKLFSYALGRSLIPSDEIAIAGIKSALAGRGYRFHAAVETIVTTPQFLHKRGRDFQTLTSNE